MARFCPSRGFILDLGGWGFAVPFYFVQNCSYSHWLMSWAQICNRGAFFKTTHAYPQFSGLSTLYRVSRCIYRRTARHVLVPPWPIFRALLRKTVFLPVIVWPRSHPETHLLPPTELYCFVTYSGLLFYVNWNNNKISTKKKKPLIEMLHVKIIDIVVSGHVIMGVVRYRLFYICISLTSTVL